MAKAQPSRKGKKAWRKNVDIEEVVAGLEETREREILVGKEEETDNGFVIDSAPSIPNATVVKTGTAAILANKSKVPGVINPRQTQDKRPVKQTFKRTDYIRLRSLAGGKQKTESTYINRIAEDGIISATAQDLWDVPAPEATPLDGFSATTEHRKPTVKPVTLKEGPIKIAQNDLSNKIIDAGKSYNPSLESWKALINKEYGLEYQKELNRQSIEEHNERIQELVITLRDEEMDDVDGPDAVAEVAEDATEADYSLSLNKPNELKIKTRTVRNKEAKHKKRMELHAKLTELKVQLKDLQNLSVILDEQDAKPEPRHRDRRIPTKLSKHGLIETPLEVKLSDELSSNLKNLKPEGNLLYDQMLNLQSTGQIESRIPVAKKRRYAEKFTEKWSYKDFK